MRVRPLLLAAFVVACAANLYGLYSPQAPGPAGFPGMDKFAHLASFLLLAVTGLMIGLDWRWWVPLLGAHAVLSEVVQHLWLAGRTGDPLDVAANLAGVGAGWALHVGVQRGRAALHRRATEPR